MNARQRRTQRRLARKAYERHGTAWNLLRLCRQTGTLEVTPNDDGSYNVVGTCRVQMSGAPWNAPIKGSITL